jgi:hypothetical protein
MEQPGWWDHVETEPQAGPTLEQRARKLVNVLGASERARKLRWLLSGDPALLTLMEAEVQRDGVTDPRRQGGAMKSICIRWWRRDRSRQGGTVLEVQDDPEESARQRAMRAAHEQLQQQYPERETFTIAEIEEEMRVRPCRPIPLRSTRNG